MRDIGLPFLAITRRDKTRSWLRQAGWRDVVEDGRGSRVVLGRWYTRDSPGCHRCPGKRSAGISGQGGGGVRAEGPRKTPLLTLRHFIPKSAAGNPRLCRPTSLIMPSAGPAGHPGGGPSCNRDHEYPDFQARDLSKHTCNTCIDV